MLLVKIMIGIIAWGLIGLWPTILMFDSLGDWQLWVVAMDIIALLVVIVKICEAHKKGE